MATQSHRTEAQPQAPVENNINGSFNSSDRFNQNQNDQAKSGEQLSRDTNQGAPNNLGAAKLEASAKQTQQLVKDNVLPDMGIDFGAGSADKAAADKAAGKGGSAAEKAAGDKSTLDPNNPLLKGVSNPEALQKDIADTVNKIAAAKDDPTKAAKAFEEAGQKFSKENPANKGQIFNAMMKDALKANPDTQKFGVEMDSSAGDRDGKTESFLTKKDGDKTNIIAETTHTFSNGANKDELPGIANKLKADIPQALADLDNPQSLQKLVEASNEMVKASGLGNDQDVKNTFEKAAAEFKKENPNASATTLATVLGNAIRNNPQSSDLQINFADGGGQLPGTGDVTLIDRSKDKNDRIMSRVEVTHN